MIRTLIDPRDPTREWEVEMDKDVITSMKEKKGGGTMREKIQGCILRFWDTCNNDSLAVEKTTDEILFIFQEEVEKLEPVDYGVYCYTRDAVEAQLAHDKAQMLGQCK